MAHIATRGGQRQQEEASAATHCHATAPLPEQTCAGSQPQARRGGLALVICALLSDERLPAWQSPCNTTESSQDGPVYTCSYWRAQLVEWPHRVWPLIFTCALSRVGFHYVLYLMRRTPHLEPRQCSSRRSRMLIARNEPSDHALGICFNLMSLPSRSSGSSCLRPLTCGLAMQTLPKPRLTWTIWGSPAGSQNKNKQTPASCHSTCQMMRFNVRSRPLCLARYGPLWRVRGHLDVTLATTSTTRSPLCARYRSWPTCASSHSTSDTQQRRCDPRQIVKESHFASQLRTAMSFSTTRLPQTLSIALASACQPQYQLLGGGKTIQWRVPECPEFSNLRGEHNVTRQSQIQTH
jgi:hypothetical protein